MFFLFAGFFDFFFKPAKFVPLGFGGVIFNVIETSKKRKLFFFFLKKPAVLYNLNPQSLKRKHKTSEKNSWEKNLVQFPNPNKPQKKKIFVKRVWV